MLKSQTLECQLGGRTLTIETGKLAGQADGAVTVRYGETVVLATVCIAAEPREGTDFVPLTIDYEERLYAAGKIPGGFIRREGRPSQEAILAARITDRPIRPLLPKTWRREAQVVITVLSADQENNPDVLSIIGASSALTLSSMPFYGPVGAVRVAYINNKFVLSPTFAQIAESPLDLVVVSTRDAIVMVDVDGKEVSEDIVLQGTRFGHQANQEIIALQDRLRAIGKPKEAIPDTKVNPDVTARVAEIVGSRIVDSLTYEKSQREDILGKLKKEVIKSLTEQFPDEDLKAAFEAKAKYDIRNLILTQSRHTDGRALSEIRPIECAVGLLPRTHGSALFTRGQTQVMTITTLGSVGMEQQIDGLGIEESKRFMHHYNFPPFSSGEVKRLGTPGRREIGHGALAEHAIIPVLPKDEDFPYTIRLVSEVLSSSGSTSMASTCASSLALMDAGVPIKTTVAGIAIGLVTGEQGKYAVLTDIEGLEDAYGDMDFKVAGTKQGITAIQLDIKLTGISFEIVEEALSQAKDARLKIIAIMERAIPTSRPELSRFAPRVYKITIPTDKIGTVIGPGGKTIRSIIDTTKATIDIEDDGTVFIGSPTEEAAKRAIQIIEGLTKEPEIGTVYTVKVTRILNFGAMVEILPGKEGLVHISELADRRIERVEDAVKIGDEISVKLIGIDNLGRLNLSRRALLEPAGTAEARAGERAAERPPRDRGGFRPPFRGRERPPEDRRGPGRPGAPPQSKDWNP